MPLTSVPNRLPRILVPETRWASPTHSDKSHPRRCRQTDCAPPHRRPDDDVARIAEADAIATVADAGGAAGIAADQVAFDAHIAEGLKRDDAVVETGNQIARRRTCPANFEVAIAQQADAVLCVVASIRCQRAADVGAEETALDTIGREA